MAMKDISDTQVLEAYLASKKPGDHRRTEDILQATTGQPIKVCWRAMERVDRRGLVEVGVSLSAAWLTEAGFALLKNRPADAEPA